MERREELEERRCAAIWRRVAPDLDPYPEERAARVSAAGMSEETLRAALEAALVSRRDYLAYARRAGGSAGRALEELARGSGQEMRRLRGIYYLLTGACWERQTACDGTEAVGLCTFLRGRYAAETGCAARFEGWAAAAEDPCLGDVLRHLAEESRSRAAVVLKLLENRLAQQG